MSLAPSYSVQDSTASSVSWRRFQKALAITGTALLASCVIYGIEKYLFRPRHRFMESPAEVMMRAFAYAHFLVGWLFLLSSPRLRRPAAMGRVLAATLVGIAACWLYATLGGGKEPLLLMAFYALFLIHETRDECALARLSGDIPAQSPFADVLVHFTTLLLIALLAGTYLVRGFALQPDLVSGMSGAWLCSAWGLLALATGIFAAGLIRVGRKHHQTFHAALEAHLPLVQIYQALTLILVFGSLLGSIGLNLVILLHVSVWFVFVMERAEARGESSGVGAWTWLRQSRAGFVTLHLGLIVVLLGLMAMRVHLWLRGGWIGVSLSSSSFAYWSLMHICMAWGVKRPR